MLHPHILYLLLGSNLGDRKQIMEAARQFIDDKIGIIRIQSSVYETEPWGLMEQPAYLNQVIQVDTALTPEEVLRNILEIECELGRVRDERWGARVIDIDVLYFDDLVLDTACLTLPHPRLHDRRFTLVPLSEIAPSFVHPLFQQTSVQLLEQCNDLGEVTKIY